MSKKITIAIDGHSSTGKSTVAKHLAKQLKYIFVDTGAMYRAVTLYAINHHLFTQGKVDISKVVNVLDQINVSFQFNPETQKADVFLNGVNVDEAIRAPEVSNYVSKIAEISAVRRKLVAQQQAMGKDKGVVMDGRDIGTVVFPDAELKIFMTATAEVRAQRRYEELMIQGHIISFKQVLENVMERDRIDSSRDDSPLLQASDALLLDNSNMTREEQFDLILSWVNARLNND